MPDSVPKRARKLRSIRAETMLNLPGGDAQPHAEYSQGLKDFRSEIGKGPFIPPFFLPASIYELIGIYAIGKQHNSILSPITPPPCSRIPHIVAAKSPTQQYIPDRALQRGRCRKGSVRTVTGARRFATWPCGWMKQGSRLQNQNCSRCPGVPCRQQTILIERCPGRSWLP